MVCDNCGAKDKFKIIRNEEGGIMRRVVWIQMVLPGFENLVEERIFYVQSDS